MHSILDVTQGRQPMKRMTQSEFLSRAHSKYGTRFTYALDTFVNARTDIEITCPVHGKFYMTPEHHYTIKHGCPACGKDTAKQVLSDTNRARNLRTTEEFISEAVRIHGTRYDYSLVEYTGNQIPVTISCSIHGLFKQRPDKHLNHRPSNCPTCSKDVTRSKLKGVYTTKYFTDNPQKRNIPALLYLVEVVTSTEHFFKIGITVTSVNQRFKSGYSPYRVNVINQYNFPLVDAFCVEQEILKTYRSHQYKPNHPFGGHNECLTLTNEDIHHIHNLITSMQSVPTTKVENDIAQSLSLK